MTDWLLAQGHWAFVILAYAASVLVFALDALLPRLRERALWRTLRAQQQRFDQRRGEP